eukprot:c37883_g1_i1.p1 GENE.c37883_g1_i1~~c37883_g1_i1.p1  ORF type:complete len:184 (+),score=35.76 c37883_g1_i1:45-596(+)
MGRTRNSLFDGMRSKSTWILLLNINSETKLEDIYFKLSSCLGLVSGMGGFLSGISFVILTQQINFSDSTLGKAYVILLIGAFLLTFLSTCVTIFLNYHLIALYKTNGFEQFIQNNYLFFDLPSFFLIVGIVCNLIAGCIYIADHYDLVVTIYMLLFLVGLSIPILIKYFLNINFILSSLERKT